MLDAVLHVVDLAVHNGLRCDDRCELSGERLLDSRPVVGHALIELDQFCSGVGLLLGADAFVVLLTRVDHRNEHLLRQCWQTLGVGTQTFESVGLTFARCHQEGVIRWIGKVGVSVRVALLQAAFVNIVRFCFAIHMLWVHFGQIEFELAQRLGCVRNRGGIESSVSH